MQAERFRRPSTALGHSERYRPEPLVLSVVQDTNAALLDLRSERCYELNEVGARIWVLLSSGTEYAVMVELLAEEYDAPRDVIAADTRAILDAMVRERLVKPTRGDPPPLLCTTGRLRFPWIGEAWATTRQ